MLNSEVPYVRYLDRSDYEDVRLHQPRCHNASAYGLRGYVDNTLPSRCYAITMILRVRRKFFEITMFPNTNQHKSTSRSAPKFLPESQERVPRTRRCRSNGAWIGRIGKTYDYFLYVVLTLPLTIYKGT